MRYFVPGELVPRPVRLQSYSLILVIIISAAANGFPANGVAKSAPPVFDDVVGYLTKYGYLPQSDFETGSLRSEEELKEAVRTLQMYGNIPATGMVDNKTLALLRRPRCGMADIQPESYSRRRKRYVLQGQKWPRMNLTWSLRSTSSGLDEGRVRLALYNALGLWSKHSKLKFQEVNSDDADILVKFEKGYHGDAYAFDGKGHVLAHAFSPSGGIGGDAHFDAEESWKLDNEDQTKGISLFMVAAHEFGHSLGLWHSPVAGSLMFAYYGGWKENFELPEDDKQGIQNLYGVNDDEQSNHGRRNPSHSTERPVQRPADPRKPYLPPQHPTGPPKRYPPPRIPPQYPPKESPKWYPPRRIPAQYPPEPPKTYPPTRIPIMPSSPVSRTPTPKTSTNDGIPDMCDTSYDAISVIRRELFIFKGKYFWRIGDSGLHPGYPALTKYMWDTLPSNFTHVDAVYERYDHKIVFFIGREIYVFDSHKLMNGYPKPLTSLGLPSSLDHIDAVMVWGYNSKTYFFSGSMYWRFDDETGHVELDYPRDMSIWRGVSYSVDAAFQWKDGATYFFKGKGFWKFDDSKMQVANERPILSAPVWMRCPKPLSNLAVNEKLQEYPNVYAGTAPADSIFSVPLCIGAVCVTVALILIVIVVLLRKRKPYAYTRPKNLVG